MRISRYIDWIVIINTILQVDSGGLLSHLAYVISTCDQPITS
jgi:hypothetical protein